MPNPTVGEVMKEASKEAKELDIFAQDVRLLLMHAEGYEEQIDVVFNKDKEMKNLPLFKEGFERLKNGEPVEYIINEAKFLENKLYVDNRVLIPRSETEELVANITEMIGDYYDPRNYLVCADVGTGSGAIAIAIKQAFPNWLMVASDISKDALDVAEINFKKTGVSPQVLLGDSLNPYIEKKINLDILISNPPYILNKEDAQESVINHEPGSALWLDKSDSVYEKIFRDYKKVKRGPMFMAFEISPDLVTYLTGLMKKYLDHYEYRFVKDLNKMTRFLFINLE